VGSWLSSLILWLEHPSFVTGDTYLCFGRLDRTTGHHHPDDDLENIAYPVIAHAYQAFGLNLQDAIDDSWSATDSEENIEKFKAVFRATVGS
jgi:hypothetical protein